MDKQRKYMSRLKLPLGTAVAFPVIIIGAAFLPGNCLPPEALAVMVGAHT